MPSRILLRKDLTCVAPDGWAITPLPCWAEGQFILREWNDELARELLVSNIYIYGEGEEVNTYTVFGIELISSLKVERCLFI